MKLYITIAVLLVSSLGLVRGEEAAVAEKKTQEKRSLSELGGGYGSQSLSSPVTSYESSSSSIGSGWSAPIVQQQCEPQIVEKIVHRDM